MSKRSSKRQKSGALPSFGQASEADSPSAQQSIPSSSKSSTRTLPLLAAPTLTTICARVFVANFIKLRSEQDTWTLVSSYLNALPDALLSKIFAMLQNACPAYLPHEVIVTYFLRGPFISLRKELPAVKRRTILDIPRVNTSLRGLELINFDDIPDSIFADVLMKLPQLSTLVLRGCTKAGAESMRAISNTPLNLVILNLNFTSVTPISLVPVLMRSRHLEVLKLAGIQNWTDATLSNLYTSELPQDFQLRALRILKLRQTSVSDSALAPLLRMCPALQRLDLSFTLIRHPQQLFGGSGVPMLRKLSLTSTAVSSGDLIGIVTLLPELQTLAIGALGANRGSRASIGNTSAMTMTDDTLRSLTAVLKKRENLENVSLVGNTKLGHLWTANSALADFIAKVGRKCKKLNMAGIHSLQSSDLRGLIPVDQGGVSLLETLILNNTGIDDEAGLYLAACPSLRTLEVAGTKMTSEGLFTVIDSCTMLESLDLTSCRGIRVVDRRRFFEVWEDAQRQL